MVHPVVPLSQSAFSLPNTSSSFLPPWLCPVSGVFIAQMVERQASSHFSGLGSHDAFSERPSLTIQLKHRLPPHFITLVLVGWLFGWLVIWSGGLLVFLFMALVQIPRLYWEGTSSTISVCSSQVPPYQRKSSFIQTSDSTSI